MYYGPKSEELLKLREGIGNYLDMTQMGMSR